MHGFVFGVAFPRTLHWSWGVFGVPAVKEDSVSVPPTFEFAIRACTKAHGTVLLLTDLRVTEYCAACIEQKR